MTGTMELIIILLLMAIQHGGDDVSCKRSIISIRSHFICRVPSVDQKFAIISVNRNSQGYLYYLVWPNGIDGFYFVMQTPV